MKLKKIVLIVLGSLLIIGFGYLSYKNLTNDNPHNYYNRSFRSSVFLLTIGIALIFFGLKKDK